MANDKPLSIEEQVSNMKKYVSFTKKVNMREFIGYTGYFPLTIKKNHSTLWTVREYDTN